MAQQLTTRSVTTGLRLTVAGSVIGAIGGAISERISDRILAAVGLTVTDGESLGEAGVELVIRGTVSAIGFIVADQAMRNIQGPDVDATQGLFFSFLFVQSQPGLLRAAEQFATATTKFLPK